MASEESNPQTPETTSIKKKKYCQISDLNESKLIQNLIFPPYLPHDNGLVNIYQNVQSDTTFAREKILNVMIESLRVLLNSPFEVFWSHVIYDKTFDRFISTYLRYKRRPFDPLIHLAISPLFRQEEDIELSKLVLLIIIRMSRFKDNDENRFLRQEWAEMIYENFIFDTPKLFNISSIFAPHNASIVRNIFLNILDAKPDYWEDLKTSFETSSVVLAQLHEKHHRSKTKDAQVIGVERIEDTILFLWDSISTLYSFLECFPESWFICHTSNLYKSLAYVYEIVIPFLLEKLNEIFISNNKSNENEKENNENNENNENVNNNNNSRESDKVRDLLLSLLNQSSSAILRMVGYTITKALIKSVIPTFNVDHGRMSYFAQSQVQESSRPLDCEWNKFNVPEKADLLFQIISDLSTVNLVDIVPTAVRGNIRKPDNIGKFLKDLALVFELHTAISSLKLLDQERKTFVLAILGPQKSTKKEKTTNSEKKTEKKKKPNSNSNSNSKSNSNSSAIETIKDMFPSLDEETIKSILMVYNNNAEQAISSLLDGENVSEKKQNIEQKSSVTSKPKQSPQTSSMSAPQLSSTVKPVSPALNYSKSPAPKYSTRSDEYKQATLRALENMYDDEYDDSYEGLVKPAEPETEEIDSYLVNPNIQFSRKDGGNGEEDGEEEEDDDEEEEGNQSNSQQSKNQPKQPNAPPQNPYAARYKSKNKARIGNHNRADRAIKKQKAMIPSS